MEYTLEELYNLCKQSNLGHILVTVDELRRFLYQENMSPYPYFQRSLSSPCEIYYRNMPIKVISLEEYFGDEFSNGERRLFAMN